MNNKDTLLIIKWFYERVFIWPAEKDMKTCLISSVKKYTQFRPLWKKPEKKIELEGDLNHDLCDTGAVLNQLSCPANWEMVTLWVRNIAVDEFSPDYRQTSLRFPSLIHTLSYRKCYLVFLKCNHTLPFLSGFVSATWKVKFFCLF